MSSINNKTLAENAIAVTMMLAAKFGFSAPAAILYVLQELEEILLPVPVPMSELIREPTDRGYSFNEDIILTKMKRIKELYANETDEVIKVKHKKVITGLMPRLREAIQLDRKEELSMSKEREGMDRAEKETEYYNSRLKPTPLWKQENPKRQGTKSWSRYEAYKHTKTLEEAKSCGCIPVDISFANAHANTHLNSR